jgi:hypothetical protein
MTVTKRLVVAIIVTFFVAQTPGCALLVGGAAAGAAAGGVSSVRASEEHHYSAMTYTGTVLANIVYFPAKVLFAGGGALTSGIVYLGTFGRRAPADQIWDASVDGDYVVTPAMVAGDRPVQFVG